MFEELANTDSFLHGLDPRGKLIARVSVFYCCGSSQPVPGSFGVFDAWFVDCTDSQSAGKRTYQKTATR